MPWDSRPSWGGSMGIFHDPEEECAEEEEEAELDLAESMDQLVVWTKALSESWALQEREGRKEKPSRRGSKQQTEAQERAGADPAQARPLWKCVELMQRDPSSTKGLIAMGFLPTVGMLLQGTGQDPLYAPVRGAAVAALLQVALDEGGAHKKQIAEYITWETIEGALTAAEAVLETQWRMDAAEDARGPNVDRTPKKAEEDVDQDRVRVSAVHLAQDTRVNGFRLLAELSELKRSLDTLLPCALTPSWASHSCVRYGGGGGAGPVAGSPIHRCFGFLSSPSRLGTTHAGCRPPKPSATSAPIPSPGCTWRAKVPLAHCWSSFRTPSPPRRKVALCYTLN